MMLPKNGNGMRLKLLTPLESGQGCMHCNENQCIPGQNGIIYNFLNCANDGSSE